MARTERETEKSEAEALLATRKAAFDRDVNVAQIEATRATETRDEELRKEVEIRRAQTEIERLRASDVVKATIIRESKQQAADAKAYEMEKAAEAGEWTSHILTTCFLLTVHRPVQRAKGCRRSCIPN